MTDYEKTINMRISAGEHLLGKSRKEIKRLCIELNKERKSLALITETLGYWYNEKRKLIAEEWKLNE